MAEVAVCVYHTQGLAGFSLVGVARLTGLLVFVFVVAEMF